MPYAPAAPARPALDDPHLNAPDQLLPLPLPDGGRPAAQAAGAQRPRSSSALRSPPRGLGEHTREVLAELASLRSSDADRRAEACDRDAVRPMRDRARGDADERPAEGHPPTRSRPARGLPVREGRRSPPTDKIALVDALSDTGVSDDPVHLVRQPEVGAADGRRRGRWPSRHQARRPASQYERDLAQRLRASSGPLRCATRYACARSFGVAASDIFTQKNTNRAIDEQLAELPGCAAALPGRSASTGSTSAVDGGLRLQLRGRRVPPERVLALLGRSSQARRARPRRRQRSAWPTRWAGPTRSRSSGWSARSASAGPTPEIRCTCTTRAALAMANVVAALEMGVDRLRLRRSAGWAAARSPSTRARPATSCTEDLVFICQEMGIETGIDLDKMIAVRGARRGAWSATRCPAS